MAAGVCGCSMFFFCTNNVTNLPWLCRWCSWKTPKMCQKFAKDKTSLAQPFGWRIGASGPWPGTLVSAPELRELDEKMTGNSIVNPYSWNWGAYPYLDGLFHGKSYSKIRQVMDDLGLLPFWETSINSAPKKLFQCTWCTCRGRSMGRKNRSWGRRTRGFSQRRISKSRNWMGVTIPKYHQKILPKRSRYLSHA